MFQSPPPNHEWLKVVFSTAIGLVAGIAAEPLKQYLTYRLTARRIERALHFEIASLQWQLNLATAGLTEAIASAALGVFSYYYEQKRELFFGNQRLAGFRQLYGALEEIIANNKGETVISERQITDLRFHIAVHIKQGTLSEKLLGEARLKYSKNLRRNIKGFLAVHDENG